MVDFPSRKVGAAHLPLFALAIRGQNERTFVCANQYPYFAHILLLFALYHAAWTSKRPISVKKSDADLYAGVSWSVVTVSTILTGQPLRLFDLDFPETKDKISVSFAQCNNVVVLAVFMSAQAQLQPSGGVAELFFFEKNCSALEYRKCLFSWQTFWAFGGVALLLI
jgi:hypothetical protein